MSITDRPIRILHQYAIMNRGGAESWIMNVMRCIDRRRFCFDFCVTKPGQGVFDEEIRDLGGRIVPCVWNRSLRRYHRLLGEILRTNTYDVVHSHGYYFSGVTLRIAAKAGVRGRIAHLHTLHDGKRTTLARIVYRKTMLAMIRRYATAILGCSHAVLETFLGSGWEEEPRAAPLYYGIDVSPFDEPPDRAGVRSEVGLSGDAPVALHVGNFVEAKNHCYLIDIFRKVKTLRPDVQLLLVGGGPLREAIESKVNREGLASHVHFLGVRSDVPRLMMAADVLVMPSVREGLPVTMIEATAAGLPVVISDMPGMREANDLCCSGKLLPVDRPAEEWAQAVVAALDGPRPAQAESADSVRRSPFSSEVSARMLAEVYQQVTGPSDG